MTETMTKPADPQIEAWLRSHGVGEFELQELPLFFINGTRSLQNQARFAPLDENVVARYAEAMSNGDVFPPIVAVADGKSGGMLIVDGNHRFAASEMAQKEKIWGYVTKDLSEQLTSVLTFDANTKHGLPTSPEERKQQAIFLVDTAEVTAVAAAKMLNVPLQSLRDELTKVRAERRLAALGVERWESMPRGTRARLDAIRDDEVFKAAAKLAVEARLSHEAINEMVVDINKTSTVSDGTKVVAKERDKRQLEIKSTFAGRRAVPTNQMRLLRSLSYAERINIDGLDVKAIPEESRKQLQARITEVEDVLEKVSRKLA